MENTIMFLNNAQWNLKLMWKRNECNSVKQPKIPFILFGELFDRPFAEN